MVHLLSPHYQIYPSFLTALVLLFEIHNILYKMSAFANNHWWNAFTIDLLIFLIQCLLICIIFFRGIELEIIEGTFRGCSFLLLGLHFGWFVKLFIIEEASRLKSLLSKLDKNNRYFEKLLFSVCMDSSTTSPHLIKLPKTIIKSYNSHDQ